MYNCKKYNYSTYPQNYKYRADYNVNKDCSSYWFSRDKQTQNSWFGSWFASWLTSWYDYWIGDKDQICVQNNYADKYISEKELNEFPIEKFESAHSILPCNSTNFQHHKDNPITVNDVIHKMDKPEHFQKSLGRVVFLTDKLFNSNQELTTPICKSKIAKKSCLKQNYQSNCKAVGRQSFSHFNGKIDPKVNSQKIKDDMQTICFEIPLDIHVTCRRKGRKSDSIEVRIEQLASNSLSAKAIYTATSPKSYDNNNDDYANKNLVFVEFLNQSSDPLEFNHNVNKQNCNMTKKQKDSNNNKELSNNNYYVHSPTTFSNVKEMCECNTTKKQKEDSYDHKLNNNYDHASGNHKFNDSTNVNKNPHKGCTLLSRNPLQSNQYVNKQDLNVTKQLYNSSNDHERSEKYDEANKENNKCCMTKKKNDANNDKLNDHTNLVANQQRRVTYNEDKKINDYEFSKQCNHANVVRRLNDLFLNLHEHDLHLVDQTVYPSLCNEYANKQESEDNMNRKRNNYEAISKRYDQTNDPYTSNKLQSPTNKQKCECKITKKQNKENDDHKLSNKNSDHTNSAQNLHDKILHLLGQYANKQQSEYNITDKQSIGNSDHKLSNKYDHTNVDKNLVANKCCCKNKEGLVNELFKKLEQTSKQKSECNMAKKQDEAKKKQELSKKFNPAKKRKSATEVNEEIVPTTFNLVYPQHKDLEICKRCHFNPSPLIDQNGNIICPGNCGCCLCAWKPRANNEEIEDLKHKGINVCQCRERGYLFASYGSNESRCDIPVYTDICPCHEKAEAKYLEMFGCEMWNKTDNKMNQRYLGPVVSLSEVREVAYGKVNKERYKNSILYAKQINRI